MKLKTLKIQLALCFIVYASAVSAQSDSSCVGRCGEGYFRGHACHCDYNCMSYMECCPDFKTVCTTEASCQGRCYEGFIRGQMCDCDPSCVSYGRCCSDYEATCAKPIQRRSPPPPPVLVSDERDQTPEPTRKPNEEREIKDESPKSPEQRDEAVPKKNLKKPTKPSKNKKVTRVNPKQDPEDPSQRAIPASQTTPKKTTKRNIKKPIKKKYTKLQSPEEERLEDSDGETSPRLKKSPKYKNKKRKHSPPNKPRKKKRRIIVEYDDEPEDPDENTEKSPSSSKPRTISKVKKNSPNKSPKKKKKQTLVESEEEIEESEENISSSSFASSSSSSHVKGSKTKKKLLRKNKKKSKPGEDDDEMPEDKLKGPIKKRPNPTDDEGKPKKPKTPKETGQDDDKEDPDAPAKEPNKKQPGDNGGDPKKPKTPKDEEDEEEDPDGTPKEPNERRPKEDKPKKLKNPNEREEGNPEDPDGIPKEPNKKQPGDKDGDPKKPKNPKDKEIVEEEGPDGTPKEPNEKRPIEDKPKKFKNPNEKDEGNPEDPDGTPKEPNKKQPGDKDGDPRKPKNPKDKEAEEEDPDGTPKEPNKKQPGDKDGDPKKPKTPKDKDAEEDDPDGTPKEPNERHQDKEDKPKKMKNPNEKEGNPEDPDGTPKEPNQMQSSAPSEDKPNKSKPLNDKDGDDSTNDPDGTPKEANKRRPSPDGKPNKTKTLVEEDDTEEINEAANDSNNNQLSSTNKSTKKRSPGNTKKKRKNPLNEEDPSQYPEIPGKGKKGAKKPVSKIPNKKRKKVLYSGEDTEDPPLPGKGKKPKKPSPKDVVKKKKKIDSEEERQETVESEFSSSSQSSSSHRRSKSSSRRLKGKKNIKEKNKPKIPDEEPLMPPKRRKEQKFPPTPEPTFKDDGSGDVGSGMDIFTTTTPPTTPVTILSTMVRTFRPEKTIGTMTTPANVTKPTNVTTPATVTTPRTVTITKTADNAVTSANATDTSNSPSKEHTSANPTTISLLTQHSTVPEDKLKGFSMGTVLPLEISKEFASKINYLENIVKVTSSTQRENFIDTSSEHSQKFDSIVEKLQTDTIVTTKQYAMTPPAYNDIHKKPSIYNSNPVNDEPMVGDDVGVLVGLGLSTVQSIVTELDKEKSVYNSKGKEPKADQLSTISEDISKIESTVSFIDCIACTSTLQSTSSHNWDTVKTKSNDAISIIPTAISKGQFSPMVNTLRQTPNIHGTLQMPAVPSALVTAEPEKENLLKTNSATAVDAKQSVQDTEYNFDQSLRASVFPNMLTTHEPTLEVGADSKVNTISTGTPTEVNTSIINQENKSDIGSESSEHFSPSSEREASKEVLTSYTALKTSSTEATEKLSTDQSLMTSLPQQLNNHVSTIVNEAVGTGSVKTISANDYINSRSFVQPTANPDKSSGKMDNVKSVTLTPIISEIASERQAVLTPKATKTLEKIPPDTTEKQSTDQSPLTYLPEKLKTHVPTTATRDDTMVAVNNISSAFTIKSTINPYKSYSETDNAIHVTLTPTLNHDQSTHPTRISLEQIVLTHEASHKLDTVSTEATLKPSVGTAPITSLPKELNSDMPATASNTAGNSNGEAISSNDDISSISSTESIKNPYPVTGETNTGHGLGLTFTAKPSTDGFSSVNKIIQEIQTVNLLEPSQTPADHSTIMITQNAVQSATVEIKQLTEDTGEINSTGSATVPNTNVSTEDPTRSNIVKIIDETNANNILIPTSSVSPYQSILTQETPSERQSVLSYEITPADHVTSVTMKEVNGLLSSSIPPLNVVSVETTEKQRVDQSPMTSLTEKTNSFSEDVAIDSVQTESSDDVTSSPALKESISNQDLVKPETVENVISVLTPTASISTDQSDPINETPSVRMTWNTQATDKATIEPTDKHQFTLPENVNSHVPTTETTGAVNTGSDKSVLFSSLNPIPHTMTPVTEKQSTDQSLMTPLPKQLSNNVSTMVNEAVGTGSDKPILTNNYINSRSFVQTTANPEKSSGDSDNIKSATLTPTLNLSQTNPISEIASERQAVLTPKATNTLGKISPDTTEKQSTDQSPLSYLHEKLKTYVPTTTSESIATGDDTIVSSKINIGSASTIASTINPYKSSSETDNAIHVTLTPTLKNDQSSHPTKVSLEQTVLTHEAAHKLDTVSTEATVKSSVGTAPITSLPKELNSDMPATASNTAGNSNGEAISSNDDISSISSTESIKNPYPVTGETNTGHVLGLTFTAKPSTDQFSSVNKIIPEIQTVNIPEPSQTPADHSTIMITQNAVQSATVEIKQLTEDTGEINSTGSATVPNTNVSTEDPTRSNIVKIIDETNANNILIPTSSVSPYQSILTQETPSERQSVLSYEITPADHVTSVTMKEVNGLLSSSIPPLNVVSVETTEKQRVDQSPMTSLTEKTNSFSEDVAIDSVQTESPDDVTISPSLIESTSNHDLVKPETVENVISDVTTMAFISTDQSDPKNETPSVRMTWNTQATDKATIEPTDKHQFTLPENVSSHVPTTETTGAVNTGSDKSILFSSLIPIPHTINPVTVREQTNSNNDIGATPTSVLSIDASSPVNEIKTVRQTINTLEVTEIPNGHSVTVITDTGDTLRPTPTTTHTMQLTEITQGISTVQLSKAIDEGADSGSNNSTSDENLRTDIPTVKSTIKITVTTHTDTSTTTHSVIADHSSQTNEATDDKQTVIIPETQQTPVGVSSHVTVETINEPFYTSTILNAMSIEVTKQESEDQALVTLRPEVPKSHVPSLTSLIESSTNPHMVTRGEITNNVTPDLIGSMSETPSTMSALNASETSQTQYKTPIASTDKQSIEELFVTLVPEVLNSNEATIASEAVVTTREKMISSNHTIDSELPITNSQIAIGGTQNPDTAVPTSETPMRLAVNTSEGSETVDETIIETTEKLSSDQFPVTSLSYTPTMVTKTSTEKTQSPSDHIRSTLPIQQVKAMSQANDITGRAFTNETSLGNGSLVNETPGKLNQVQPTISEKLNTDMLTITIKIDDSGQDETISPSDNISSSSPAESATNTDVFTGKTPSTDIIGATLATVFNPDRSSPLHEVETIATSTLHIPKAPTKQSVTDMARTQNALQSRPATILLTEITKVMTSTDQLLAGAADVDNKSNNSMPEVNMTTESSTGTNIIGFTGESNTDIIVSTVTSPDQSSFLTKIPNDSQTITVPETKQTSVTMNTNNEQLSTVSPLDTVSIETTENQYAVKSQKTPLPESSGEPTKTVDIHYFTTVSTNNNIIPTSNPQSQDQEKLISETASVRSILSTTETSQTLNKSIEITQQQTSNEFPVTSVSEKISPTLDTETADIGRSQTVSISLSESTTNPEMVNVQTNTQRQDQSSLETEATSQNQISLLPTDGSTLVTTKADSEHSTQQQITDQYMSSPLATFLSEEQLTTIIKSGEYSRVPNATSYLSNASHTENDNRVVVTTGGYFLRSSTFVDAKSTYSTVNLNADQSSSKKYNDYLPTKDESRTSSSRGRDNLHTSSFPETTQLPSTPVVTEHSSHLASAINQDIMTTHQQHIDQTYVDHFSTGLNSINNEKPTVGASTEQPSLLNFTENERQSLTTHLYGSDHSAGVAKIRATDLPMLGSTNPTQTIKVTQDQQRSLSDLVASTLIETSTSSITSPGMLINNSSEAEEKKPAVTGQTSTYVDLWTTESGISRDSVTWMSSIMYSPKASVTAGKTAKQSTFVAEDTNAEKLSLSTSTTIVAKESTVSTENVVDSEQTSSVTMGAEDISSIVADHKSFHTTLIPSSKRESPAPVTLRTDKDSFLRSISAEIDVEKSSVATTFGTVDIVKGQTLPATNTNSADDLALKNLETTTPSTNDTDFITINSKEPSLANVSLPSLSMQTNRDHSSWKHELNSIYPTARSETESGTKILATLFRTLIPKHFPIISTMADVPVNVLNSSGTQAPILTRMSTQQQDGINLTKFVTQLISSDYIESKSVKHVMPNTPNNLHTPSFDFSASSLTSLQEQSTTSDKTNDKINATNSPGLQETTSASSNNSISTGPTVDPSFTTSRDKRITTTPPANAGTTTLKTSEQTEVPFAQARSTTSSTETKMVETASPPVENDKGRVSTESTGYKTDLTTKATSNIPSLTDATTSQTEDHLRKRTDVPTREAVTTSVSLNDVALSKTTMKPSVINQEKTTAIGKSNVFTTKQPTRNVELSKSTIRPKSDSEQRPAPTEKTYTKHTSTVIPKVTVDSVTARPFGIEEMENNKTDYPLPHNPFHICDLLKDNENKMKISDFDLQRLTEICLEMKHLPFVSTPSSEMRKPQPDDKKVPSGHSTVTVIQRGFNQPPGSRIIQIVEEIKRRANIPHLPNFPAVPGQNTNQSAAWLLLLNKFRNPSDPQMNLCNGQPADGMTTLQNGSLVIFRGHYFWILNQGGATEKPRKISEVWGIPSPIDTVFTRCNCGGKTFFFKGPQYWRFTNDVMDYGYPKQIVKGFGGLQGKVTAVLTVAGFKTRPESVYFFRSGGNVQKYTFRQEQSKRCTKKKRPVVQYPIYSHNIQTVKYRFPREIVRHRIKIQRTYTNVQKPSLGVLHEEVSVRSTFRGIPNNIVSAMSLPNPHKQDGYDYFVFSKEKYYNINMSSMVAVKPPPQSEQRTSKDWYKCKE